MQLSLDFCLCFELFYPTNAQDLRTLSSDFLPYFWGVCRESFFSRKALGYWVWLFLVGGLLA